MTIALLDNLHVALPEMVILTTALLALLASLFLGHKYRSITLIIALIGLTISAVISSLFIGNFKTVILGGQFVSDDLAQLMKLFIAITVFLSFYYSKDYIAEHQLPVGDYYVLGLFSALGMMVLGSSHSLLTIYLGVELLSLPIYAMTAIRRNSGDAIEAALKYFTMGSIASGILLYGLSFVYGATGKLEILDIANAIASGAMENEGMLLAFALVFIVTAIGFKLAAFPFHMWAPDVYQGAPTSVTLFISTAP
ncbi:MAG: NADH:ubiquinone oxidoreductase subunit N, partial [Proteobacteria bacterium]|nr:NADH:ubiquinone oxidoreductase subunit N [Pseudomonadota bacterium]